MLALACASWWIVWATPRPGRPWPICTAATNVSGPIAEALSSLTAAELKRRDTGRSGTYRARKRRNVSW